MAVYQATADRSDFVHVYVNPAFQALRPLVQMTGRTYSEVWPEFAASTIPRFREVLEAGTRWRERDVSLDVEGVGGMIQRCYFTHTASLLRTADETLLLHAVTDVTGEVKGRNALRDSEAKYRSLFTHLIEAFAINEIVLDENGRPVDYIVLEINNEYERVLGRRAEEIVGRRITEIVPGFDKDPWDWIGKFARVAFEGTPMRFEQYSVPLGRWYQVSAYQTEHGRVANVFEDITERKRNEDEREEALRWLSEKDRVIRQAYSDVIDAVTGGRLIILSRDEIDAAILPTASEPFELREPWQLAEARDRVKIFFGDAPRLDDLLLAFSEGATNMLKHAGGGSYRIAEDSHTIQLVLSDKGPGIDFRDLPKATLVPGFSTKQTLGMGFSLMMEIMDRLLLSTDAGGTTLLLERARGNGA